LNVGCNALSVQVGANAAAQNGKRIHREITDSHGWSQMKLPCGLCGAHA
jgi:hypothetical protein